MTFLALLLIAGGGYWLFRQLQQLRQQQAIASGGVPGVPPMIDQIDPGPEELSPPVRNNLIDDRPYPATPLTEKKKGMNKYVFLGLCLLYIVSPIDLIPDIPVLGWPDDIVAGILGLRALMSKK